MRAVVNHRLDEIMKNLDSGYKLFVSRKSGCLLRLALSEPSFYFDCDDEEEVMTRISESPDEFVAIEKPSDNDELVMMKKFVSILDDEKVKGRLVNALLRNRPQRSFISELSFMQEGIKKEWIQYRDVMCKEYILQQLK